MKSIKSRKSGEQSIQRTFRGFFANYKSLKDKLPKKIESVLKDVKSLDLGSFLVKRKLDQYRSLGEERKSPNESKIKAIKSRKYDDITKNQLYTLAKGLNVKGRSKMSKEQLYNTLKNGV